MTKSFWIVGWDEKPSVSVRIVVGDAKNGGNGVLHLFMFGLTGNIFETSLNDEKLLDCWRGQVVGGDANISFFYSEIKANQFSFLYWNPKTKLLCKKYFRC